MTRASWSHTCTLVLCACHLRSISHIFFVMIQNTPKQVDHPWDTLIGPCLDKAYVQDLKAWHCLVEQLQGWTTAFERAGYPNFREIVIPRRGCMAI